MLVLGNECILKGYIFSFLPKPRLTSPHGEVLFVFFYFCLTLLWIVSSFLSVCSILRASNNTPPACVHSRPGLWNPCETTNLEVQLPHHTPVFSSGGLSSRLSYLLCLKLLFHIPAPEDFSYVLANSSLTFKGYLQNILGSISVLGRFSRSLVLPKIENRHPGTVS